MSLTNAEGDAMSQPRLAEVKTGELITGMYLVRDANVRQTRRGDTYLDLTLCDRSGELSAKLWDYEPNATAAIESGQVLRVVAGRVEEYKGTRQIVLRRYRVIDPSEVNPADFLPATDKDINELELRLRAIVDSVEAAPVRELLQAFLDDQDVMNGFREAPAALRLHHAYLGGLLEHTVAVCELALLICSRYSEIRRDLLIAGAMLHDIGKTREMSWCPVIKGTDHGGLVGHLVTGVIMVQEKARGVRGLDAKTLDHICHLILSHHGKLEFGSPRVPATREAIALHLIDNIDAKLAGVDRAVQEHGPSLEAWTDFQRMFESRLFLG